MKKERKKNKIWLIATLVLLTSSALFSKFVGKFPIVHGHSMEPTYHSGDILFTNNVNSKTKINYGDVVIATAPDHLTVIKRVIGLPGDTVSCSKDGDVLVNGEVVDRSYSEEKVDEYFEPVTCGDKQYFLMGDNTNHSTDSRYYGPFDRKDILGIVNEAMNGKRR